MASSCFSNVVSCLHVFVVLVFSHIFTDHVIHGTGNYLNVHVSVRTQSHTDPFNLVAWEVTLNRSHHLLALLV